MNWINTTHTRKTLLGSHSKRQNLFQHQGVITGNSSSKLSGTNNAGPNRVNLVGQDIRSISSAKRNQLQGAQGNNFAANLSRRPPRIVHIPSSGWRRNSGFDPLALSSSSNEESNGSESQTDVVSLGETTTMAVDSQQELSSSSQEDLVERHLPPTWTLRRPFRKSDVSLESHCLSPIVEEAKPGTPSNRNGSVLNLAMANDAPISFLNANFPSFKDQTFQSFESGSSHSAHDNTQNFESNFATHPFTSMQAAVPLPPSANEFERSLLSHNPLGVLDGIASMDDRVQASETPTFNFNMQSAQMELPQSFQSQQYQPFVIPLSSDFKGISWPPSIHQVDASLMNFSKNFLGFDIGPAVASPGFTPSSAENFYQMQNSVFPNFNSEFSDSSGGLYLKQTALIGYPGSGRSGVKRPKELKPKKFKPPVRYFSDQACQTNSCSGRNLVEVCQTDARTSCSQCEWLSSLPFDCPIVVLNSPIFLPQYLEVYLLLQDMCSVVDANFITSEI